MAERQIRALRIGEGILQVQGEEIGMTSAKVVSTTIVPPLNESGVGEFWVIRRGAEELVAPSFEAMVRWCQEGRVASVDLVLHPTLARWMPAQEVPQLSGFFPPRRARSLKRPLLMVVAAVVFLPLMAITTCAGFGLFLVAADSVRPPQIRTRITMISPGLGDANLRNVSNVPIEDVDVEFGWGSGPLAEMRHHVQRLEVGEEIHLSLRPEVNEEKLTKTMGIETYSLQAWNALNRHEQERLANVWSEHNAAVTKSNEHSIGMAFAKAPSVSAKAGSNSLKVEVVDETPTSVYVNAERDARDRMEDR